MSNYSKSLSIRQSHLSASQGFIDSSSIKSQKVLLCHHCGESKREGKIIECQNPPCEEAYCSSCLTKYFKYSKKIVKRLPSATWLCPKCSRKCTCKKQIWLYYRCIPEEAKEFYRSQNRSKRGAGFQKEVKDLIKMKSKLVAYSDNPSNPCIYEVPNNESVIFL